MTFRKGSGDQKFIPNMSPEALHRLCGSLISKDDENSMLAIPPYNLGFPGKDAQSSYYPGQEVLTREEIETVSRVMEQHNIFPENTRISKETLSTTEVVFTVLQASVATDDRSEEAYGSYKTRISLSQGDHKNELFKICEELRLAADHAANDTQRKTLELYIKSFETGDLEIYRDALRSWVRDLAPKVEHIIGFVEPYRDPYGIRAEFEGLVAIADPEETSVLRKLVEHSDNFITNLPWCSGFEENSGKGPFEKSLFEPPDFSSMHGESTSSEHDIPLTKTVLAYCSSIIFPGINLPNVSKVS